MTLTLNQVLGIILTVAAVVAVTFLVLFLNQLRRTAREGEKTLVKAQETMDGLQVIEAKINSSLDNVGEVLAASKKVVSGLSGSPFSSPPASSGPRQDSGLSSSRCSVSACGR